nr:unnamed protein product [Callosobruchus analis]
MDDDLHSKLLLYVILLWQHVKCLPIPFSCLVLLYLVVLLRTIHILTDFKLKFSNRLYVDYGHPINISYAYEIKELYDADVIGTNFDDRSNVVDTINKWIKMQTAGKMSDELLEGRVSKGGTLLPVNNLHFEAKWPHRFVEKQGYFKAEDGHKSKLTFLTGLRNTGYEDNQYLEAQVLSLAFVHRGNLKVVMNVFLPHDSLGFGRMLEKLSKKPSSLWRCPLKQHVVNMTIPEFELTYWAPENMWIPGTLHDDKSLLNYFFAPKKDLDLNKIFPGAVLAGIDTRAYITVPEPPRDSLNPAQPEVQFTADHPFAFSILTEPTGDLLYVGTFKGHV